MMRFKILLAFLIKLFVDLPVAFFGLFIVPIMLLSKADMSKTWWGNRDHPDSGGEFWAKECGVGFWCSFQWFALRNSTFNFSKYVLGYKSKGLSKRIAGSQKPIGNHIAEGWYFATEGWAWEFYYVKKTSATTCRRLRCGWKLDGTPAGNYAQFCFAPSLKMDYSGA